MEQDEYRPAKYPSARGWMRRVPSCARETKTRVRSVINRTEKPEPITLVGFSDLNVPRTVKLSCSSTPKFPQSPELTLWTSLPLADPTYNYRGIAPRKQSVLTTGRVGATRQRS